MLHSARFSAMNNIYMSIVFIHNSETAKIACAKKIVFRYELQISS